MNPCEHFWVVGASRGLGGRRLLLGTRAVRGLVVGLGVVIGAGVGVTQAAATPTFTSIAPPQGATSLFVRGISDDGRVVVGNIADEQQRSCGFRWREGEQVELFGGIGSYPYSTISDVSGDGRYAAASRMIGPGTRVVGFRVEDLSQPEQLPQFGGYVDTYAYATSHDGSVVVGFGQSGTGIAPQQAYRWTSQGGMQGLGFLRPEPGIQSQALAVSADGNTIVGISVALSNTGLSEAFVWTPATGMQMLRAPEGSFGEAGIDARGVSGNGRFVVGAHTLDRRQVRGVLWDNGNPLSLGLFDDTYSVRPKDVSSDGQFVVGIATTPGLTTAIIWTPQQGMEALSDYLMRSGIAFPAGSTVFDCVSVTDDGRMFAGTYALGDRAYGFVATIPNVGSLFVLGASCFVTTRRRVRAAALR